MATENPQAVRDATDRERGVSVDDESPAFSPIKLTVTHESTFVPGTVLSDNKKWGLLAVFSLAMFIDILLFSAFFIFALQIATDLDVPLSQQSWVITSYTVTFSSFLLFWGRVSDLFSAKTVFCFAFLSLGIINLIISFLPDKFSFFVFRALCGIVGAALIPSAYRLIAAVFDDNPKQKQTALLMYGMAGALANVSGVIIAGVMSFIPTHGQGADWRWFFRLTAFLVIPVSLACLRVIPPLSGSVLSGKRGWRHLDIVGSLLMLVSIIMLILSLTLGASNGWKSPAFLVPFFAFVVLFPAFFLWEARCPEEEAMLPPATWKIPNFTILIVFALYAYGWWGVNFFAFVQTYLEVYKERPIIAAVRIMPQGITAALATTAITRFPKLTMRPRNSIFIGMSIGLIAYVLFITSTERVGTGYWKFIFTGMIIGSPAMQVVFSAINVGVMTSVPAEMSGVAGAVLQVALQVGSAIALSIQAGLLTVGEGGFENWSNTRATFIFEAAWGFVWLVAFGVFYHPTKREGKVEIKMMAH